jgi:hypothetical protein
VVPAVQWSCRRGHSCRLGAVTVEIYGADFAQKIGPVDIVAMFAHDRGSMKDDILFGLGGGTLAGRRLEVVYNRATASLVEEIA